MEKWSGRSNVSISLRFSNEFLSERDRGEDTEVKIKALCVKLNENLFLH